MALVQVPIGVAARQIDDFPEGCKRSRKGALYVRPRSTMVLTSDELDHLKAKHKDVAGKLIVVGVDETKARSLGATDKGGESKSKSAPKTDAPKAETPKADGGGDDKKKKKKLLG